MSYNNIIFEIEDGVAVITLNRPEAMNALCGDLNTEMLDALSVLSDFGRARVLILTGGRKVFAAGADIKEMLFATPLRAGDIARSGLLVNEAIESLPIPTIAAVSGAAIGGGCELALACDFRVAGESAVFSLPEVGLGIMPGAGGTQRLLPLVGLGLTREMVMLGRRLRGREAVAVGLANRLADDDAVMETARALAAELMKMPAISLMSAKKAVNEGANNTLTEGKKQETAAFALTFSAPDQREGMQAMLEKRPPQYTHSL
ncbi:MAG: enoyl-CoA hydratase/isomerase family protein [Clostridiales Family XIII bacterium]|nr:enoyl-CoA hydratase/isomerase family protein [Clostridiales Family XIII bacterium]